MGETQEITWELFDRQVEACRLCPLCRHILHKVPGQGDRNAPLMLIGEGPGQVEDEEGLAFVGPAGQLLTKMLEAISLPRERGKWTVRKGVWIMPTYHPSALLRDPAKKLEAWEDMKNLRSRLVALGLYPDLYSGEK